VAEKCITAMTNDRVTLNLNQYGALVSWSFNEGCGAAESSTLIQRLNNGENPSTVLPEELPKWVYGGTMVLPGLVRRRNAEVALSKEPTSDKALPVKC
jgi:lysozyme